jgi:hypothetical protein
MKAKIVTVGIIQDDVPIGWCFDCMNKVPMVQVFNDGSILYAGYSIDELSEISNRPAEWVEL